MEFEFSNIAVSLDAMLPGNEGMLARELARACGLRARDMASARLVKRSVDARKKSQVHFVVTVAVDMPHACLEDVAQGVKKGIRVKPAETHMPLEVPDCTQAAGVDGFVRPVVVGAGPAGLFAALCLARAGLRPLIVERGRRVEDRISDVESFASGGPLDVNSNVQFGEGGAGTFSDGKLNTGTKSPLIRHVLEEFVAAGAPQDILIDAKPHIGTDLLPGVVRNIRKTIEAAGGEFRFDTQLSDMVVDPCASSKGSSASERSFQGDGDEGVAGSSARISEVVLTNVRSGKSETIACNMLVLAIGHSARDTYELLYRLGVAMERKPFAVGVRIEHLQRDINKAQYGSFSEHPALGAANYKIAVHNDDGRGVYTFCMCPGGTVVAAASEQGALCVNGMSTHARDGLNANSALLVEVRPDDIPGDDVTAGIALQRRMERDAFALGCRGGLPPYTAPAQTVGAFLGRAPGVPSKKVTPTYPCGVSWVDLRECLPGFVAASIEKALPALDRKLRGFADPEAVMVGVEPRSSSPVRLRRDKDTLQAENIQGLYPAGEGAGYAGGITSAAVDGLRVALKIASSVSEGQQLL